MTESRRYTDPFGNPRGTTPTTWAGDKGFVGGTQDATTGLTNLGAREYQPATGRFISADPILDAANSPQQWNGYAYGNNDPVGSSDPTGAYTCRNGHEGCDIHGNACGGDCSAQATQTGDCVHTECGSSTENQNPQASLADQRAAAAAAAAAAARRAQIDQVLQDIFDYYHKKLFLPGYCSKGGCMTQAQFDQADANLGKILSAMSDMTLIIPNLQCIANSNNQHACWIAGCAIACGPGVEIDSMSSIAVDLAEVDTAAAASGSSTIKALLGKLKSLTKDCARNSFPASQAVLMADGSRKQIGEIKVGDTVLATDPLTGMTRAERVTAVVRTLTDTEFTDLAVRAKAGHAMVTSTRHHPYWNATAQRWVDAASLRTGERLRTDDGTLAYVDGVRSYSGHIVTFNLTVADIHTYYVLAGNTPILVHNGGEAGPGQIYLWRGVTATELADISANRTWNSPQGIKYFSFTEQGAAEYSRRAYAAFPKEGPYTMIRTTVNASDLPEAARMAYTTDVVDGGVALNDSELKILGRPAIMTGMSTGVGCG
ncbi:RHS repeat-associated protein [Streptacidiphilus sp. MAP12-20]|uniref:RHS repeat-associated core domain-containing protein n=1 Tax=Streptacidiphilus sp. MAP12-20 TaxID=3156299 RepID=UPI003515F462